MTTTAPRPTTTAEPPVVARLLAPADVPAVRAILARDPVRHCVVASRLLQGDAVWRHDQVWGMSRDGALHSLALHGANLIPVGTSPADRRALASRLAGLPRRCSSLVGPVDEVMDLWDLLAPVWGPAREIRDAQPVLATSLPPEVTPDPHVAPVRVEQIDAYLPAAIAMFTEEVGMSPLAQGGGALYRARVLDLIRHGRAFARWHEGRVIFKAEVAASAQGACQVQGVWVDPAFRGQGYGTRGMAAVIAHAQAHIADTVSLYVNEFNVSARAIYDRVGMRQVDTFATVLL